MTKLRDDGYLETDNHVVAACFMRKMVKFGKDDLELVIGGKVLPLPMKVTWKDELQTMVNEMIDK